VSHHQGLTKDDNFDLEAIWHVLETALIQIHTKNASTLSFEELYRNAYKLVLKKKGDVLYERVSLLEDRWLRDNVRISVSQLVTPSIILGTAGESFASQSTERRIAGERFMRQLKDAHSDHHLCMSMIVDVLMYMVRIILSLPTLVSNLKRSGSRLPALAPISSTMRQEAAWQSHEDVLGSILACSFF
jgi:cullin 3